MGVHIFSPILKADFTLQTVFSVPMLLSLMQLYSFTFAFIACVLGSHPISYCQGQCQGAISCSLRSFVGLGLMSVFNLIEFF